MRKSSKKETLKGRKEAQKGVSRGIFDKILLFLLDFMPVALFFSYEPVIMLGSNEKMNFELSVAEIWLVLFSLFCLARVKKVWQEFGAKKLGLAVVIPMYMTISASWSENSLRAILTAGIMWLLVFSALNIISLLREQKKLREELLKILLISAGTVAAVCLVQCVLDVMGVGRAITGMCVGCTYTAFGFPHPNGFAIEPQFMGNLLLAPTLLCFYLVITNAYKKQKRNRKLILLTVFLTTTLFLTLSRGAIYAFLVGLVMMIVLCMMKKYRVAPSGKATSAGKKSKVTRASRKTVVTGAGKKVVLASVGMVVISAVVALVADGVLATLSPTNDTFVTGVTKAVHQLSLGVIDLRPDEYVEGAYGEAVKEGGEVEDAQAAEAAEAKEAKDAKETKEVTEITESTEVAKTTETSTFSGYVAESTNVRMGLNELAIETWVSSAQYIVVGAGLGSAGPAMNQYASDRSGTKEIVQNECLSILLELGIIGVILILGVAIYAWVKVPKNPLFIAMLVSFAFSLLFFSGLPNALHIYLLPVLFAAAKDDFLVKDIV